MDVEELMKTPEHPRHQQRWMLHHPRLPLCLGCLVMILEDRQKLNTHKRFVLNAFLENLRISNQDFARVVQDCEEIILKTLHTFLALISKEELPIAPPAAECVVYMLGQLKKKQLDDLVAQMLMEEIQKQCSYERCLLRIRLLGHLSLVRSGIIGKMICYKQGQFLQFLASGLNFPCEKIKSAIAYIFASIYKEGFETIVLEQSLHAQVADSILCILKTAKQKDLQINALVVLQALVRDENLSSLFLQTKKKDEFPLVLKKLLLSRETSIQITAAQSICALLSHSSTSTYADILMNSNIPEFLFEALLTSNELLIETLLCSICLFTKSENFLKSSHAIYGIEAILRCTDTMLELRNWRLSSYGLNLISTLLDKHPVSFSLIPTDSSFRLVLRVIDRGLMSQQVVVAVAGSKLLVSSLRYDLLPQPIPIQAITPLLTKCVQFISKSCYISSRQKQAYYSSTSKSRAAINYRKEVYIRRRQIQTGLLLVQALIKIHKNSSTNPVADETSFTVPPQMLRQDANNVTKPKSGLFEFSLATFQQMLWPYIKSLTSEEFSEELIVRFFEAASDIYEFSIRTKLSGISLFNKTLLSTSFVSFIWQCRKRALDTASFEKTIHASNRLLKLLLISLLMEDSSSTEDHMNMIETGVKYFDATLDSCCIVLSQPTMAEWSDVLFSTQATFLQMCYYAYLNEDSLIPALNIRMHTIRFILGITDLVTYPLVCKYTMFLLAVTTEDVEKLDEVDLANTKEATLLVRRAVLRSEDPSLLYTHHKAMFSWSLLFAHSEDTFHQYIVYEWLKRCQLHCEENYEGKSNRYHDIEVLFENIFQDAKLQENCIVLLLSYSYETSKKASGLIKDYVRQLQDDETSNSKRERKSQKIIEFLNEKLPAVLLKMLLDASFGQHEEMKITIVLDLLIWCREQRVESLPYQQTEIKLVLQIMHYVVYNDLKENMAFLIWRYLMNTFTQFETTPDLKAVFSMLSNKNAIILLEAHLDKRNETFSSALGFLSKLVRYQTTHNVKWSHQKVALPVRHLLHSLYQANFEIQVYALQIMKELLSQNFDYSIVLLKSEYISSGAFNGLHLSCTDIRSFFMAILNILVKTNAETDAEAVECLQCLISYLESKKPSLAAHCMSSPWLRIVLEARFSEDCNECVALVNWKLLLMCIKSPSVNASLILHIKNIARKIGLKKFEDIGSNKSVIIQVIKQLCTGPYSKSLDSELALHLKAIAEEMEEAKRHS